MNIVNQLFCNMRRINIVLSLIFILSADLLSGQVSFGKAIKINDGWEFKNRDYEDEFKGKANIKEWRIIDLPHDWSVEGPYSPNLASCTGYLPGGIGWYKKLLTIPAEDKGKQLYIYFGGVYCNSEVWINGQSLGKRPNGYVSFMYDLTPHIKYGSDNLITVKVDHSKYADSRWYTGSGIYRDVYLIKANPVHIDQWGIHCYADRITDKQAYLNINTTVKNTTSSLVRVTVEQTVTRKGKTKIIAKGNKRISVPASSTAKADIELKISNPSLWSPHNPDLYEVNTTVTQGKQIIDKNRLNTGIRTIRFDANKGFFLNGENMKLKGACIHHDAGSLGAAVYRQIWERRLKELKDLGCNAIRTSHNPQDDMIYSICDEIGLLVIDEAFDEWEYPKRKWIEGWNVGIPWYDGYAAHFNEWGERDITDMVNQHKNHPSIIMWSIGNEVDYPNDPYSHPILDSESINQKAVLGYKPNQPHAERLGDIAKKLAECVRKVDTSRPVTAALAGVVMSNHTDYPFVIDVTGYNYAEDRYEKDHATYPQRIIYGSENRHELDKWLAVKNNDFIAGQFLWTGIDYLGESGPWPSRGSSSGLLDLGGFKKPRGYYRESLWSDKPMAYLGTLPEKNVGKKTLLFDLKPNWNYNEGEKIRVVCFSNTEKVVLKLNDKTIDIQPMIDKASGGKYWIIPFEAGTLEAIAYLGGKEVASYQIKTSEAPANIVCKADRTELSGKGDIAQIEIILTDKNEVKAFPADNEIKCTIKGKGKLLGLENSDLKNMSDYKTNKLRVYQGRLIAYIMATDNSGTIDVEFSSNWLKPGNISLKINTKIE